MLEFNDAGLLVPPTIIDSTLSEFERYFSGDNPDNIRTVLYNQYIEYIIDLKRVCAKTELKQWIDGSFVTKKSKPFDIDLVTFIDEETLKLNAERLKNFVYPGSLTNYGLDGYFIVDYPESHKNYFMYKSDCAYWIELFGRTKSDKRHKSVPKGFLEIIA